jgi:AcrR family transcriptional regulator
MARDAATAATQVKGMGADVVADDRGEPNLQAVKSAKTRARLIEATIRCLVKHGYSKTTTPKVALEAGLSRGAMLHHFDSGRQLMQATLVELNKKRLRAFRRAAETKDHNVRTLVRAYWAQLLRPTFIAFHELATAARTDKELAETLDPVRIEFRERWHELALELFPEWRQDLGSFDLSLALSQNLLEGMALNRLTNGVEEGDIEAVLVHLEQQILELRPS